MQSNTSKVNAAVEAVIKESYLKHRRVVFNGNGYTDEWVHEAGNRGLPHIKNTPDSLAVLKQDDIISLFENHGVFTAEELESRYHIYLEKFSKQINIEAGVTIEMARRQIFPAVSAYAASLARDASALAVVNAVNRPQAERAKEIAVLCNDLYEETGKLETILDETREIQDVYAQASCYSDKVRPAMDAVRKTADALEKLVSKDFWPFPGYEELLFKL